MKPHHPIPTVKIMKPSYAFRLVLLMASSLRNQFCRRQRCSPARRRIARRFPSALFNAGNAAQRAGRLGPAILDYERARLLAPRDPAVVQNLAAARQKAGIVVPAIPAWQRPAHWLSFNALAVLISGSLLFANVLFFGRRFIPGFIGIPVRGLAILPLAVISLGSAALALRWNELDRAVIVAASPAGARLAPAANAAVSFELKPGEIVRPEAVYGDFVRIRSAGNGSGWVAAAALERIIPPAL